MSILRRFTPVEGSLFALLGVLGALYALPHATWPNPTLLATLLPLFFVIEMYPMQMKRVNYTFSFPLLFTMGLTNDFSSAALVCGVTLLAVQLVHKRPWQIVAVNVASRMLTMLLTGWTVQLYAWMVPNHRSLAYFLTLLALGAVTYTVVSTCLIICYMAMRLGKWKLPRILFKLGLLNVGVGFAYVGFMIWLAMNPKNTGSGDLGTLFFFLPLAAVAIVAHLFTNLTRTKRGLLTMVNVSQSINQQQELQTVLQHIVDAANALVSGACGVLYLVQEDGALLQQVATTPEIPPIRIPPRSGIVGVVAETGEALLLHDALRDSRFLREGQLPGTRSLLVVPVMIDGRVAGVISLGKKETHSFVADDLKMMTVFATHAAVAMKNALYIEERERRLLVEERNRLAREIHDGLAQDLASALLQIEMMKRQDGEELEASLNSLQGLLRQTAGAVRHSIYALRPAPYSHVGLVPAIRSHLDEVTANTGLRTHFEGDLPAELRPAVSQAVFQILGECVKNVVKHAQAQDLFVTLRVEEGLLRMTMRDNGIGFHFGQAILSAAARKSFGIENVHHLADQVGGSLDYLTAPGQGTVITLEIPIEEKEEDHHEATKHTRAAL